MIRRWCPDPEDQFFVFAAVSGRVHQPYDMGGGGNAIERFAGAGVPKENISFERDTYTFNVPGAPSELLGEFRTYYGPTMNAFEAAAASGREAELQTLFNSQNASPNKDSTSTPATFLRVTVST